MLYKFKYPEVVSNINSINNGIVEINMDYISDTHSTLLNFLNRPEKQISVIIDVDAPIEVIWGIAGGDIAKFFFHQPAVIGVSEVSTFGSDEGARFVVHRNINGGILDRFGEVITNIENSEMIVSDIDIADQTISGMFPCFYGITLEPLGKKQRKSKLKLTYTMLSVPHPFVGEVLIYQANSIKQQSEASMNVSNQ